MCIEFLKRNDPDLPFHYYTSSHTRYYAENMPDFNQPPRKQRELRRPPRREVFGPSVGRRITFAVHGSGSVRSSFHNVPVSLPPLPGHNSIVREHSYVASEPLTS